MDKAAAFRHVRAALDTSALSAAAGANGADNYGDEDGAGEEKKEERYRELRLSMLSEISVNLNATRTVPSKLKVGINLI